MLIPLVLVVLPLGLLLLLSGLIVNAIQAILFVSVRPLSKSLYRRINRFLVELIWLQLIWLVDWWAGVKVQLHADPETYQLMGKEHALIISNHRSDIDWLIRWILAQRSGCLGSTLAIMKKSSKFLPVIGWSMWFAEYLFLERSWAKVEKTLKWGLKRLKDFLRSFWLALFVEGTRFTPAKLLAAQEYAASQAIYDTTVIIPKDSPAPTMLRILKGQSSVDALLDKHIATGTFDEEIRPIGCPMKSLLVVVLVMPPPIWCLQILTVDSTLVNVERHYPLRCWIGTGDWCYACLHHVLSVRAFKLRQSSEESGEERLMTLDSSPPQLPIC
ncbi:unnamed protein product [Miscanthus lutarioriparius]|uniref:Phospholipid/glycerol acyltransferase domain-containing protein n=1 Tax=Miscanthus lutarioriparius TaxID=422564 RepID=A0A811RBV1_9POAL|nr:unnamed protein product [Miscanthus lutarioriparius]